MIIIFNHTNKWYMHNSEFVLENETHKPLWDFEIQTGPLISARRPDLAIINKRKRTYRIVYFVVMADHRIKLKESKRTISTWYVAEELRNMKVTWILIVIGVIGTVTKRLIMRLEEWEVRGG